MQLTIIKGLLVAGMLAGTMSAQTFYQQEQMQQDRIAQGVRFEEGTPHETARLEYREARLNHEIRRDRYRNAGYLTERERIHLERQQHHIRRVIYRERHHARCD